jgi:hypothetical protein
MEAKELSQALSELRRAIGPEAELYCSVDDERNGVMRGGCVYLSIRPYGILKEPSIGIYADTFEDVLVKARATWQQHMAAFTADKIKKMALAVIRLTFEHGECTDKALRKEGFAYEDIKVHGAAAVEQANTMAGNRPFKIITATVELQKC